LKEMVTTTSKAFIVFIFFLSQNPKKSVLWNRHNFNSSSSDF
jgi:hypothetical protein